VQISIPLGINHHILAVAPILSSR